jgi:hypothetical protein
MSSTAGSTVDITAAQQKEPPAVSVGAPLQAGKCKYGFSRAKHAAQYQRVHGVRQNHLTTAVCKGCCGVDVSLVGRLVLSCCMGNGSFLNTVQVVRATAVGGKCMQCCAGLW